MKGSVCITEKENTLMLIILKNRIIYFFKYFFGHLYKTDK